ncbi:MAG: sugar porter family MFS transporter [Prolixibacteraceae bacterium]|jgi:SP family sugar:H+ symporter-like MFS transporter|nr:sugar porter family MFS transporter [Prolixibacteraceae bacterium]
MEGTIRNSTARVIFLSMVASLGGFLFGFDSGVINGTVDALQKAFNSDAVGTGFNVASVLLGCAAGAFFAGMLADRFGRKPVLIVAGLGFIISAWGSGIASGSAEFVFYRLLGGLSVGAASIISPAYISEIAPSNIRGRLTSLQQLAIVLGLFFSFFSNYNLASVAGGASDKLWWGFDAWQWMFWMELVPALVFFICLLFIPESPRYLVAAGKAEKAITVLASMVNREDAKKQVVEIKKTMVQEQKPRLLDIVNKKTKKIHPIVWVGIGLAMLQTFTGIDVVFYYGSVLWQAAGFTESDALLTNVIIGAVNIAFTILAIFLVDRIGRKPLLMIGGLGQALMLGLMAAVFVVNAEDAADGLAMNGTVGIMALLAAIGFIAFFALTWGPVMWVMLGEMFPNKYRGAALAMAGMSNWLANFLVTITFPVLLTNFGLGISYGVYAVFGIVAFAFVYRYVKETKGKTLEEISLEQE